MKNNKSLGQHWLYNRQILDEIARLCELEELPEVTTEDEGTRPVTTGSSDPSPKAHKSNLTCIEIGPGLGTLTSSLLRRFDKVIAVEFDENLARNLPKSFPGKNLEVVNEDILEWKCARKLRYVVAGNIPYYITSPIIKKFLTIEPLPERIVLLIQKEVAERIVAEKESVLSLFVKNYAEAELGPVVKKAEFTPPPKVDSQVLVLTPRPQPLVDAKVFGLIKMGFKNPRKKLLGNLAGLKSKAELKQIFHELKIDENARPADLKLEDWAKMYQHFLLKKHGI